MDACITSLSESELFGSPDVIPEYQSAFDKINSRIDALERYRGSAAVQSSLAAASSLSDSKRNINWSLVLSVLAAVLALCAFVGGVVWVGHSELSRIDGRMGDADRRTQRMEISIKILADAQGGKTKELVNDALTVAQRDRDAGQTERAQKVLAIANELVAEQPLRPQNQDAARELLAAARRKGITIPATDVQKAGTSFIEAAGKEPKAWNVVLDFVSYRSLLNEGETPKYQHETSKPAYQDYMDYTCMARGGHRTQVLPPGVTEELFSLGFAGTASAENAALMDLLDDPPPNGITSGAQYMRITFQTGFGMRIDDCRMRNVTIRNARILYDGGQTELNHVFFVNCTFEMKRTQQASQLGEKLLASSSVNFKAIRDNYSSMLRISPSTNLLK